MKVLVLTDKGRSSHLEPLQSFSHYLTYLLMHEKCGSGSARDLAAVIQLPLEYVERAAEDVVRQGLAAWREVQTSSSPPHPASEESQFGTCQC